MPWNQVLKFGISKEQASGLAGLLNILIKLKCSHHIGITAQLGAFGWEILSLRNDDEDQIR